MNPDILEIGSLQYSAEEYEFYTAKNGADGFPRQKKKSHNWLFLDWLHRPKMDGIESCGLSVDTEGLCKVHF